MSEQEEKKQAQPQSKLRQKPPVSNPKAAVLRERDWGDRTDEPDPGPAEETYRDGSMKNECW